MGRQEVKKQKQKQTNKVWVIRFPHSQRFSHLAGWSQDFQQSWVPPPSTPPTPPPPPGQTTTTHIKFSQKHALKSVAPSFPGKFNRLKCIFSECDLQQSVPVKRGRGWLMVYISFLCTNMRLRLIYSSFTYFKLNPKQMGHLKIKPHVSLKHAGMTPPRCHWSLKTPHNNSNGGTRCRNVGTSLWFRKAHRRWINI